jgi:tetratricopeptide (TPR) repeat protein
MTTLQQAGTDPQALIPAREFDRLALLLAHSQRGAWVFCLYNTAAVRDAVVQGLRGRLAPLPVHEFTLSPTWPNPLAYRQELPSQALEERALIVFYDAWRAFEHDFFGHLDLGRDRFWDQPHSLLFWITPQGRAKLARRAPNFFSRHSGVFDFCVAQLERLQELRGQWAGTPVRYDSLEERERLERLYRGLLREYEDDPQADPATVADLWGKLAQVLYFANAYDEAEGLLHRRLSALKAQEDAQGQADTCINLGLIHLRRYALDEAERAFRDGLALAERVGKAGLQAQALANLADVQRFRDDLDAALASYNQALALFRAIGDRLGEANTMKAIGDVQRFRDDLDAALASYDQALALFRAIGSRLGEANTMKAIGDATLVQGKSDEALAIFAQAMTLYEQADDRVGQTNINWTLGNWMAQNGDFQSALPLLEQALAFVVAIQHPLAQAWGEHVEQIRQQAQSGDQRSDEVS